MWLAIWLTSAALAARDTAAHVGADAPAFPEPASSVDVYGEARLRAESWAVPEPVDGAVPTWAAPSSRVIAGVHGHWLDEKLHLVGELEVLNGPLIDRGWRVGLVADEVPFTPPRDGAWTALVLPRQARATWAGSRLQGSLGLESFAFGTGILANDGRADEERWFGDAWSGSVMARARLGATPWRPDEARGALRGLGATLLADQVVRDDNANWLRGDRAQQVYVALSFGTRRLKSAVFSGRRWQSDFDELFDDRALIGPGGDVFGGGLSTEGGGWTTRVTPVVAWAEVEVLPSGGAHHLRWSSELVHLRGTTTRLYNPETGAAPATVRSLGGLTRIRWDHDPSRVTARLDGVYASGDNDPRDGVARAFTFHSDFNLGMLLYEQVLPWLGARAADGVADPDLMGEAPTGLRHAIPQGGVTNTMALAPAIRWRPWSPVDVRMGMVFARGAGDVIDLNAAARAGGFNVPYSGGSPDDRGLGVELDAGVHARLPVPALGAISAGLEAAVLRPGSAIDVPELGTPKLVRARLDVQW